MDVVHVDYGQIRASEERRAADAAINYLNVSCIANDLGELT